MRQDAGSAWAIQPELAVAYVAIIGDDSSMRHLQKSRRTMPAIKPSLLSALKPA